jgi:membrane associated rhomboid family serine protease
MAGRFSFSTPGSGAGARPWFRIGQIDVTTTVLVVLLCVASMFIWAIDTSALRALVLFPDKVLDGELWRLITWPLATEPLLWTVITLAIFWYFGREIEGLLGRNRFAWFLVIVTLVPALFATALDLEQAGIRPIEFAVFLVFVAEYPFARFFFGIPAWAIGAVFVGLEVLQLIGQRNEQGIVFLFVTIATAGITARSMGLAASLPWIPKVPLPGSSSGHGRRSKPARAPRRSSGGRTVVEGPWGAPPARPPQSSAAMAAQMELDDLLDKISATGMDSLTPAEKRRLNELSKKLR